VATSASTAKHPSKVPATTDPATLLGQLARSFYLSLGLLPEPVRGNVARTYLLARAADTVADTDTVPEHARDSALAGLERSARMMGRGEMVKLPHLPLGRGGGPYERALIANLGSMSGWMNELPIPARRRSGEVLTTLVGAMRRDRARFARAGDGRLVALPDEAALDSYLYGNAGCVGRYWAREVAAHSHRFSGVQVQALQQAGIHLGKALQRVNVLRDLAGDLRRGRCYLPRTSLAEVGLTPADLYFPDVMGRLQPLLEAEIAAARRDLAAGQEFFRHLPRHWVRMRAAAAVPAVLARRTLDRIAADPVRILDYHDTVKVPRGNVYRLMGRLLLLPPGNRALDRMVLGPKHARPEPAR
jgi:farnesyl-diphosphate farnesyltransferase